MKFLATTTILASWATLGVRAAVQERQTTKPLVDCASFQDQITKENLQANLVQLSDIATANGGNRAFGLPGYAASVDYIFNRISSAAGAKVWKQDFSAPYSTELRANLTVNGEKLTIYGLYGSPDTPAEGITAQLVAGPNGTAACEPASYADLDVDGKIVIVTESLCPGYRDGFHAGVMKPAAAAGATAVIVINDFALNLTAGNLGPADDGTYVPTGFVNQYIGDPLKARLAAGEVLTALFWEAEVIDSRVTQNVFAETEGGDGNNLGAHLDSVAWGPGINDNGSGTSLLLELFLAFTKYATNNKIRFAWWGAEEKGLIGSRYYVNNLATQERDNILAYLNFDMVAKGYYGVFDGDGASYGVPAPPGSDVIQELFTADFVAKGINVTAARFTNGSDYASWQVLGKPIGGLHTGTGSAQDPCYHQECDNINNPDLDQLTVNAKTTAHVLSALALDGTNLIKKLSARVLPARAVAADRVIATVEESEDEHHHC